MFDRGFVKWQPFNAVASPTVLVKENNKSKVSPKPILFPEEQEKISEQLIEAFYEQNKIKIYFYENGQIKNMETCIIKLCPNSNTLYLQNAKIISFNQIVKINS